MPHKHAIETRSGKYLNLSNPNTEDIVLSDIAYGLTNTCRFAGHCSRFYSVCEHTLLVSYLMGQDGLSPLLCYAGLHHDDTEAYLGDVTTPLKSLLPEYKVIEARLRYTIIAALSADQIGMFAGLVSEEVKAFDKYAMHIEAEALLPSRGKGWTDAWEPPIRLQLPRKLGNPLVHPTQVPSPWALRDGWLLRDRELRRKIEAGDV
jgi:hypothetical protein